MKIDTPSGVLVVLDPGLGRFWRHTRDPRSPRPNDGEEIDLAITGPDAVAAGRAYDRQFDPRYLYDITEPVQRVMVEHGQLLCVDLEALGELRVWESLDGLGDVVFRSADASDLADRVGVRRLDDGEFGWTDLPMAEAGARADHTQRLIDNRWGDGIFTVVRHLDAAGELVRIRLDVGDEDTAPMAPGLADDLRRGGVPPGVG
ncbi:hypothetical protein [Phytohabitans kaempferiae]|uniref:Uncharacterized protein n=1 Tax=Phytohabitans kaempferiae TaxID=1620943 RepID=A0ABV6M5Y4_9ACTN